MNTLKIIPVLFFMLFLMQCAKDESIIIMEYHHTYCANNWEAGNSTQSLVDAVLTYFEETHQIELDDINITFDSGMVETCNACSCLDGQTISVEVAQQYVDVMKEEGFFIP